LNSNLFEFIWFCLNDLRVEGKKEKKKGGKQPKTLGPAHLSPSLLSLSRPGRLSPSPFSPRMGHAGPLPFLPRASNPLPPLHVASSLGPALPSPAARFLSLSPPLFPFPSSAQPEHSLFFPPSANRGPLVSFFPIPSATAVPHRRQDLRATRA
jgi:hypothetical protein